MKRTDFVLVIITTLALLAASQGRAAVKVEPEEPAESNAETPGPVESKAKPAVSGERSVAFRTIANTFITASPSNALDFTEAKLGKPGKPLRLSTSREASWRMDTKCGSAIRRAAGSPAIGWRTSWEYGGGTAAMSSRSRAWARRSRW